MALAETANLIVKLSLAGNFASKLGAAEKSLGRFGTKLDQTESRAYRAGQQIGTGIRRGLGIAAAGVGILAVTGGARPPVARPARERHGANQRRHQVDAGRGGADRR